MVKRALFFFVPGFTFQARTYLSSLRFCRRLSSGEVGLSGGKGRREGGEDGGHDGESRAVAHLTGRRPVLLCGGVNEAPVWFRRECPCRSCSHLLKLLRHVNVPERRRASASESCRMRIEDQRPSVVFDRRKMNEDPSAWGGHSSCAAPPSERFERSSSGLADPSRKVVSSSRPPSAGHGSRRACRRRPFVF